MKNVKRIYSCVFHAKKLGAFGLWSVYKILIEAESRVEAIEKICNGYEGIQGLKIEEQVEN